MRLSLRVCIIHYCEVVFTTNKRLCGLRQSLGDFEVAVVVCPHNRKYLTGFSSSEGFLLVTPDSAVLVVDSRYLEAAEKIADGFLVKQGGRQLVADEVCRIKAKKVAVEDTLTLAEHKELQRLFHSCGRAKTDGGEKLSALLREQRAVKDKDEIATMKKAASVTDKAFSHILSYIKPGVTERELAIELDWFLQKNADGSAFATIALCGAATSLPHGEPTCRVAQNGDFLLFDFGAMVNGYANDMTRTVALGEPSKEKLKIYDIVLTAKSTAMAVARAGISAKQVDAAARDVIAKSGYKEQFGHGTGHALGLEVHEYPAINSKSEYVLKAGNTVTIEPGIYLKGNFGVRIEDTVVIEDSGNYSLNTSEDEMIVL